MFGFRGSQLAREIEQIFQAKTPLDQNQALHLSELVVALRREVQQTTSAPVLEELMSARNCWWLTTIDHWLRSWSWRLMPWGCGWILRICPRPGMQSAAIPHVVVLNLCSPGPVMDSLRLLAELNTCTPQCRCWFSQPRSFAQSGTVARLGTRFYTNPPAAELLEAVTQGCTRTSEAKVMAVDDDPQVLVALKNHWSLGV